MTTNFKDVAIRALKTFWQAALAYLVTALGSTLNGGGSFTTDTMKEAGIAIIVGAVAAGLSAVYNGFCKPYVDKHSLKESDTVGDSTSITHEETDINK